MGPWGASTLGLLLHLGLGELGRGGLLAASCRGGREDCIRGAQVSLDFTQAQSLGPQFLHTRRKGSGLSRRGWGGAGGLGAGQRFFPLTRSLATCTPVWQFFK